MLKVWAVTYSTPPGWHPDPGHTGEGPRLERWWDGSAWTDEVRSATAPAPHTGASEVPAPAPPAAAGTGAPEAHDGDTWVGATQGLPTLPPYPPAPPARSGNRRKRVVLSVTAGIVVLAIAGGAFLLGRGGVGGSDDNTAAGSGGSGSSAPPSGRGQRNPLIPEPGGPQNPGSPQAPGSPQDPGTPQDPGAPGGGSGGLDGAPPQPQTGPGVVTDAASGISIPLLKGWTGQSSAAGANASTGEYTCPGDATQKCQRAGVSSLPALNDKGLSAKEAAEKDIKANATASYGGKVYGKISSHQQLKAEAVTVAGQKGYLVRWKVVTAKGDDGYVQSLAFPSPSTPKVMVVVQSGFDVSDSAPKLSVMDQITSGIKVASGGAGGSGQGI
jgi:hypothetical protein